MHINGAGDAAIKLTNSDTGATNGDGADIALDASEELRIMNRENNKINFWTNGNKALDIDGSGHVTMPLQSSFHAKRTADQTGYNAETSGQAVILYNTTVHDTNSDFDTSTGKFTAPVDGVYYFQAAATLLGNDMAQAWFVVNNAREGATDTVFATAHQYPEASAIIKLDANDTVGFKPYKSGATSITVTASANHTWFRGTLLH